MGRGRQRGTGGRLQTDRDTKLLCCWRFHLRMSKLRLRTQYNLRGSSLTCFNRPCATRVAEVNNSSAGQFHKNNLPTSTNSPSSDRCLSIAAEPSKARKNSFSGSSRSSLLPVFRLDQFHGISYPEMFPLVQRC